MIEDRLIFEHMGNYCSVPEAAKGGWLLYKVFILISHQIYWNSSKPAEITEDILIRLWAKCGHRVRIVK